ncbi:hypothetical protein GAYE_SCF07G2854 [Galdieria yellowstonensis]|uniref:Uncharacterized protein n=1 Tax=Galdieria yellowstonensis TaxID=3028027 RepID=A0AAV9ICK9_9RHOD|nr:hypothetical protein GAYE_SCF07G2854 [Galdieria yellowstonensis]
MTTSAARKRIVASEKFEEKVVKKNVNGNKGKKNSFWSSLPVSPVVLGFILFVVLGNWVLKLFQSCKVEGQRESGIGGALAL